MVNRRGIKAGNVCEGDHLPGGRAQKVLVALQKSIDVETVARFGEKRLRLHFRIHGLAENFIESYPEQERTQIIDVGEGPKAVDVPGRVKPHILAPFFEG